jgi:Fe-S oxidoreductase/nitrate reductase gamma subunit
LQISPDGVLIPMPTRTIFFHISPLGQALFYLLALLSAAVCLYGVYRRVRLWRQGRPTPPVKDWPARMKSLLVQVVGHRRTRRRPYAGKMHMGIFFGMLALFIGTCIVGVEHYGALLFGEHWLYKGGFYLACKVTLDLFGLALLIGTVMALARRYTRRPPSVGHEPRDGAFLLLLLTATLTGFLLEGAGIAADPDRWPFAAFSPVGQLFAPPLKGITPAAYAALWWVHVPLVLGVIAALPYGRWLHLFSIPLTIALQPDRPMGALEPIPLAQVEETGRIGLGAIADMDRWQLMSLDACMECGRCTDVCPAYAVGKELNPKRVVLDLRAAMEQKEKGRGKREEGKEKNSDSPSPAERSEGIRGEGAGGEGPAEGSGVEGAGGLEVMGSTDVISDESLWACTNCHACVRECPALIRHVDILDGIRRYRVAEGRLAGSAATMLRQLTSRENPWGLPASQRLDWTKGLDVPIAMPQDKREVLLWVGCASAYEPRAQKTIRALAQLLQQSGVRFAILGPRERCTGDPARRTGDEFLFQQLAESNIATLTEIQAQKIVASCPHCFHTIKNEYPQFGGQYEVLHHTQYLAQLVEEGRLQLPPSYAETVTYHDPCFLARVNRETEAPRRLLNGAQAIPLLEVPRRESKTFCCGAGGGRMWMEEPPTQRPGVNRAQELLATGAKTVAVGCPFCKVMVGDSIAQVAGEQAPPVMDVAEVMLAAIAKGEPQAVLHKLGLDGVEGVGS